MGAAAVATEFAEPHVAQLLRAKKFRQQSDKGSVTALRQRQRRSGWSLSRVRRLGPRAGWAASSAATVRLRSSALGPWAALCTFRLRRSFFLPRIRL